jgi:hypothetical protein
MQTLCPQRHAEPEDSRDAVQIEAQSSEFKVLVSSAQLRVYSILQGLVVTLVNIAIALGMETAAHIEKHTTTTAFIDSVTFKLSLFYFLNSFVVPIVAVVIISTQSQLWCAMCTYSPTWPRVIARESAALAVAAAA